MITLDKKKISNILEYVVIFFLFLILISKGGYYKRDFLVLVTCINVIFLVIYCLDIKKKKQNSVGISILLLSMCYVFPVIFKTCATITGTINTIFKLVTAFSIYTLVLNSENKEKYKNVIILFAVILSVFGIDEITFRIFEKPLNMIGSGYLDEKTGVLSSVIQYANVTGIIVVIASILVLEKISKIITEKNSKNESNKNRKIVKQVLYYMLFFFFCIIVMLTKSKMCILLLFVSAITYKIINKEYRGIIVVSILLGISLLLNIDNVVRFKDYFTSFDSTKTRFLYYNDALKLFTSNIRTILFGQGGNAFRMLFETVQKTCYISNEVHSTLIQILLESGICGLCVALYIFFYTVFKCKDKNMKLVLITLSIFSLFDVFYTYAISIILFSIILALCNSKNYKEIPKLNICTLVILSLFSIYMIKISIGYVIEPRDTENANNTLEAQEKIINRCKFALVFDQYDIDIRESYTKASSTYLDIMDIKKEIYGEDNIEKRKEIVNNIYNNTLKEIEYEPDNKYAIDDNIRVITKYVDYLVLLNYEENIKEGYEYYLALTLGKIDELNNNHALNEASKVIVNNNYVDIYDKYSKLNYILNSEYIANKLDIIKEKANRTL